MLSVPKVCIRPAAIVVVQPRVGNSIEAIYPAAANWLDLLMVSDYTDERFLRELVDGVDDFLRLSICEHSSRRMAS